MSKDIKDISQSLEKATITEDNLIDLGQDDEPSVASSTVDNLEHKKKWGIENKPCKHKAENWHVVSLLLTNSAAKQEESPDANKQRAPTPPPKETGKTALTWHVCVSKCWMSLSALVNSTRQFQADMPTFDFHRFLEQMKEPSANHIARYTKG